MACPFGRNNGCGTRRCAGCGSIGRSVLQAPAAGRIVCGGNAYADAITAARTAEAMRRRSCAQCTPGDDFCCGDGIRSTPSCGDAVARDLYGAPIPEGPLCTTCSDPCVGRREYCLEDRDPFWPTFARPRWLSCDELYGTCEQRLPAQRAGGCQPTFARGIPPWFDRTCGMR